MKCFVAFVCLVSAGALTSPTVELRTQCKHDKDPLACIKYRAVELLDEVSSKDAYEVTEGIKLIKNGQKLKGGDKKEDEARGILETLEDFALVHDVQVQLPDIIGGSTLTLSPRELDSDKITLNFDSPEQNMVEGKSRKSKLRKLLIPLMVFVLLKAMTLIPLALGVLGLKAWNALQLSFFSFVTSLALAIFNLCKKVASDTALPVPAHTFDPYHYSARNLVVMNGDDDTAHQMAYNAYIPSP